MLIYNTAVIESNNFLSKDMNTFISEDDIYVNFDKFEHGDVHVCFVTGPSGSGKSTLARKLARKYNAEYVELDLIIYAAGKKLLSPEFLKSRGECSLLLEYMELNNIDYTTIPQSFDASARAARYKIADAFITWLVTVNKRKCVIEGVNLTDIIPMHPNWKGLPFVFKGTSLLKAALRRIGREGLPKFGSFDELLDTICSWDNMYRGTKSGYDHLRNMTMRHKGSTTTEVDEDSLTAQKMGIIFSDDDIHYNVNRFLKCEVPVLWITGMSGGGKSTLAKEIADKAPGVISLLSIDNIDEFVKLYINGDIKTIKEWCHFDKVYDLLYKFILDNKEMIVNAYKDIHGKEWPDFVTASIKYILKSYTTKKQIVIEGVQIPYIYMRAPRLFKTNCAIIIKGTSVFTSLIRRYKRDQDRGWFINNVSDIKRIFDMYSMWYRTQNKFRRYVTPNTESYIADYQLFPIHHQETEYTCGPAVALSVMRYFGDNSESESEIAKAMNTDPEKGTTTQEIIAYFKNRGYYVNSSLDEGSPSKFTDFQLFLDYNLAHNRPIMVENKAFDGHWRVIIGYDDSNNTLIMADPYNKANNGITVVDAQDFFNSWYDTNLPGSNVKTWVTAIPPK